MTRRSSEVQAFEEGYGPICDRCYMLLAYHGDTATGQLCDMNLAFNDLWAVLGKAMLGERRYEKWRRADSD